MSLSGLISDREAFQPVLFYTAAWSMAYLIVRHTACRRLSADFANRVISAAHALVAMAMAAAAVDARRPFSRIGQASSPAEASGLPSFTIL
jgi:hypothetical protein